jgi:flagellar hook-associated protein 1 FlgK
METAKRDGSSNHLFDKRLEILKDISQHIQFDYHEDHRGAINLHLANGMTLVSGIRYDQFLMDSSGTISLAGFAGQGLNEVLAAGAQGKIATLLDFRRRILPEYTGKLDSLAISLASAVNAQHHLGFERGGNPGGDFFAPLTRALDMKVNIEDPERIAASATVNHDGENARKIAALGEKAQMGTATTYAQFWSALVAKVGSDTRQGQLLDDHRQLILNHLLQRREEVSGVSIDEEMMNLMKYQMGYNAAAQLVKTADELLESLIRLGS